MMNMTLLSCGKAVQSNSILEMRLRRLTGLERGKIESELNELEIKIADFKDILAKPERVDAIIKEEMLEIKKKYADDRRTHIDMTAISSIADEALIPVENILVTLTNKGYVKRVNVSEYRTQNRGGVGVKGMSTSDEDFATKMINMETHDYILFFSNRGRVYRMKGYEVPEFTDRIYKIQEAIDGEIKDVTLFGKVTKVQSPNEFVRSDNSKGCLRF